MKVIAFYCRPQRLGKERARDLARFCASAWTALGIHALLSPGPIHAASLSDLAGSTFGTGGPAAVIVQLMLVGVVGWLLNYIVSAAGQGQIAGMIKVTTVFVCISLVAKTAWGAIQTVAAIAGFK